MRLQTCYLIRKKIRVTLTRTKEFYPITALDRRFKAGIFIQVDANSSAENFGLRIHVAETHFKLVNGLFNGSIRNAKNIHNNGLTRLIGLNRIGIPSQGVKAEAGQCFGEQVLKSMPVFPVVAHPLSQGPIIGVKMVAVQAFNFGCRRLN